MGFPGDESGKEPACQCRGHKRRGSIPGLGRSPGVGTPSSIQCAFTNPILLTTLLFPSGNCVCFLCLWLCFSFINKFIGTIFLYWCKGLTHWKRLWCWERLKGTTDDEMVGWHHWLNGHGFEQAPGVGDQQGSLEGCSPWGCKESDTTEWLNCTIF